jgi:hypothetical protein
MCCRFGDFEEYFRLKVARMLSDATDMQYLLSEKEKGFYGCSKQKRRIWRNISRGI